MILDRRDGAVGPSAYREQPCRLPRRLAALLAAVLSSVAAVAQETQFISDVVLVPVEQAHLQGGLAEVLGVVSNTVDALRGELYEKTEHIDKLEKNIALTKTPSQNKQGSLQTWLAAVPAFARKD